jgi:hypothetical protein
MDINFKYHRKKARHFYLLIMDDTASCGHHILKAIHPDWYIGFRKHWMALQELDSSTPDLPRWAK